MPEILRKLTKKRETWDICTLKDYTTELAHIQSRECQQSASNLYLASFPDTLQRSGNEDNPYLDGDLAL